MHAVMTRRPPKRRIQRPTRLRSRRKKLQKLTKRPTAVEMTDEMSGSFWPASSKN